MSALLADFFAAIRSVLPDGERSRQVKERLSEYAQLAVPALGAIPMFGQAAQGVAQNVVRLRADRPLQSRFDDLAGQLRLLHLRVLVVLDDVDRLQPDELLMLLKAIRLLARFPGIYYLLAYDEQTVVDVLTCTAVAQNNSDRALAYLEKIVQVRLDLPPAQRFYTEDMLSIGISDLLARLNMSFSDEQTIRFRLIYDTLLQFTLSQPRAVGRFVRQAVAYLPMLEPGEFDVVDFLVLSHLRTLAPATYRLLARSKWSLVVSTTAAAEGPDSQLQDQVKEKLAEECPDYCKDVLIVIAELFPAFSDEYQARCQTEDWSQWAQTRRAAIEEYFDRYFVFGVPADDIADSTAHEALAAIAHGMRSGVREQVESVVIGPDRGRADRLVGKLTRLSSSSNALEEAEVAAVLRYALALPSLASRSDALLGSSLHQSVTWATALLGMYSRKGWDLDTSMLRALTNAEFAVLCRAVSSVLPGNEPGAAGWVVAAREQVADIGCELILANLRDRDDAGFDLPVPLVTQLVNRTQARTRLARAISSDLAAGRFTLADLAARFVAVAQVHDGKLELVGNDYDALVALLGADALRQIVEGAKDLEVIGGQSADIRDAGWPSRRRVGLIRLTDALQQLRAAPPQPPSGVHRGGQPSAVQQTGPNHWASRISAGPPNQSPARIPLCLRAAVLVPRSANGLPSGLSSTAVSEQTRAQIMLKMLDETPLTAWCLDAAKVLGLPLRSRWTESRGGNRLYAEFMLGESASAEPLPMQAHCMISAGTTAPAQDAIALGLDLVISLPWAVTSPQDAASILSGDKLSIAGLIRPCEIIARSAITLASNAAADLLGLEAHDGHLALWLATTQSLEEVIDLSAFPSVGNQIAQSQASVFATLPLEPGQADDSPDFSLSLRATAVELMHELLRSAQRRDYIEFLHSLRSQP